MKPSSLIPGLAAILALAVLAVLFRTRLRESTSQSLPGHDASPELTVRSKSAPASQIPNATQVPSSNLGNAAQIPRAPAHAVSAAASPSRGPEDDSDARSLRRYRFGADWSHESDPRLKAFSSWATRFVEATSEDKPGLIAEGTTLAKTRRAVMRDLIEHAPETAIAASVPFSIREQLPPEIVGQLEERVSGVGSVDVLGAVPRDSDALGHPSVWRTASVGDRVWTASVYGARWQQRAQPAALLHGVALDDVIALSDSPQRILDDGEPPPAGIQIADERCPVSKRDTTAEGLTVLSGTNAFRVCSAAHVGASGGDTIDPQNSTSGTYANLGTRRVLVIRVDFADAVGSPTTESQISQVVREVSDFFYQNSFEQLRLAGPRITSLLRMPQVRTWYTNSNRYVNLLNDARTAASRSGINLGDFEFTVLSFPEIGYRWIGLGRVGNSGVWIQGAFTSSKVAHELGHNMGLYHAGGWTPLPGDPIPHIGSTNNCRIEYGNRYDVMGGGDVPTGHFSSNFKFQLGWLTANEIHDSPFVGIYRLYAMDAGGRRLSNRHYAMRLRASVPIFGGAVHEDYWIDYRSAIKTAHLGREGATVQWGTTDSEDWASLLLDLAPDTAAVTDAALPLGATFNDLNHGVSFTVWGRGGQGRDSWIDIAIGLPTINVPLDMAIGNGGLHFTSTGTTAENGWVGSSWLPSDGGAAALTLPQQDNQVSTLATTVTGPGDLSFWWRVSSETNWDFLTFKIDGNLIAAISGEAGWQRLSFPIAAGQHALTWTYRKDGSISEGFDCAWVDQVRFTSNAASGNILFVDAAYRGPVFDGSIGHPFVTVTDAALAAPVNATLRIGSGNYVGAHHFTRAVHLEAFRGVAHIGTTNEIINPIVDVNVLRGRFQQFQVGDDGRLEFQFKGIRNQAYRLESSDDLVHWETGKEFVGTGDVQVISLLSLADSSPQRFFRTVVPAAP